ncbi:hypothetical protein, partial [Salmonella enterica]|uniref:hypothetical protein n=1 Tax=Salmonella enterica TaxID=28901 RepID=UPI0019D6A144
MNASDLETTPGIELSALDKADVTATVGADGQDGDLADDVLQIDDDVVVLEPTTFDEVVGGTDKRTDMKSARSELAGSEEAQLIVNTLSELDRDTENFC